MSSNVLNPVPFTVQITVSVRTYIMYVRQARTRTSRGSRRRRPAVASLAQSHSSTASTGASKCCYFKLKIQSETCTMYSVNKSPQIGDVSPRTQTTVISTKYGVIRKINAFSKKKQCCKNAGRHTQRYAMC